MRAAVYLRISADREGREPDVERQRADCLTLAGRLGADVVEVYQDHDAQAFADIRRPAYRRMLADAGARRFGTVIAYTLSRLAEQPSEYEDLIELAQRHGVRFAYVRSAAAGPASGSATSALVPIVGAVNTFRRLAGDLAPELKGLVSDAAPVIEPLAEGVAGFVRNAIPGLRGLVRESAPFVTEVSRSLPPLGKAVGAFLGSVSPGAAGASAFVNDVIGLASAQALFWGEVVRRLSQKYLTVRGYVTHAGAAFAALPHRARHLVLNLFDQATNAVGVGIGSALGARGPGSLPVLIRERLTSTLDSTNTAASALAVAATEVLAKLPARLGKAADDLGGSVRGARTRVWGEGRDLVDGAARGAESAADFALAIVERATGNILAGVRSGLSTPAADAVTPWTPAIPAPVGATTVPGGATAVPAGITVNGVNINLYGTWDPTDSAAVDRVVAGVYEALNRYREEYA